MTISLATLLVRHTKAAIFRTGLQICDIIGLPVSTWQPGDPSRAQMLLESEVLEALEEIVIGFIRSGFLDYARELAEQSPDDPKAAMWLKIIAEQGFGVTVPDATYATTAVTLTNASGYLYDDIEAGALTFKSTTTEKTYRNTTGGTLASGPGTTLSITVVADEPGSASSASAGEIDDMVTTLTGVTGTNPVAAVGVDEQSPATTVQQCRDKLGPLSPNGPKDAYRFVAMSPELTGTNGVTRARAYGNTDTGDVTLYLAGPSGGVSEADRALVEIAILRKATPLCITPEVLAASNVTIAVTYELWIYKSSNKTEAEVEEAVEDALEQMFAAREIGGDIISPPATGAMFHSLIESTIRGVFPQTFRVELTAPAGDTAITHGQVAALGTVTPLVNFVVNP